MHRDHANGRPVLSEPPGPPARPAGRGAMLSHATGIPALFLREQAKAYGTRRIAEGEDPSGRSVLLVEDVITTGGDLARAARVLRELGCRPTR